MEKIERKKDIKITSLTMGSIYNKDRKFGKSVIGFGLFSEFIRRNWPETVDGRNFTREFIMVKDEGIIPKMDAQGNAKNTSLKEIREELYKNGFDYEWPETKTKPKRIIHYRYLCRTTGKAKNGDCLFVNEEMYEKCNNYLTMNLHEEFVKSNSNKIVEMSAYKSLILGTANEGLIHIPLEHILIVEDKTIICKKEKREKIYKVGIEERQVEKEVIDWKETERLLNQNGYTVSTAKKKQIYEKINRSVSAVEAVGIQPFMMEKMVAENVCSAELIDNDEKLLKNTVWDGMGVVDISYMPDGCNGFIYCRSSFFKACLFAGRIQEYFRDWCVANNQDYDTYEVKDMFGNSMKVKDIWVITTENAIKWTKFKELMSETKTLDNAYIYWKNFMNHENNNIFAIMKTAHKSKYGNIQRGSYQIYNSLPTTNKDELKKIADTSIEYFAELADDEHFMKHLSFTANNYNINDVFTEIYKVNPDIVKSEWYKKEKYTVRNEIKDRLKAGKLFQEADNLTICHNPVELLEYVLNQKCDIEKISQFSVRKDTIEAYTKRFDDGEFLFAARSPHNSANNIVSLINTRSEALERYFDVLGENVIVVNAIGTDFQPRASGSDADSDVLFVTNQPEMAQLAKKAYNESPTIVNMIPPKSANYEDKDLYQKDAHVDSLISSAQRQIGESTNVAQLAQSYLAEEFDSEKKKVLEKYIVVLSVLGQCAIDSGKRIFDVKISREIRKISKEIKEGKYYIYPEFYALAKKLKKEDKYIKQEQERIISFNCPMDILLRILDKHCLDLRTKKSSNSSTEDVEIFDYSFCDYNKKRNSKHVQKIKSMIESFESIKKKEALHNDGENNENLIYSFDDLLEEMNDINITEPTMLYLIKYAFSDKCSYRNDLLNCLYRYDKKMFMNFVLRKISTNENRPQKVA